MPRIWITKDSEKTPPLIPMEFRWAIGGNEQEEEHYSYTPPSAVTIPGFPVVEIITDVDWLIFKDLVGRWRRERGAMSSITEAALCPAYQSIIGMGEKAIRLILAELQSEGDEADQWFWALRAITGADPVHDEDRGDFVKMARSWLWWAEREGYAW